MSDAWFREPQFLSKSEKHWSRELENLSIIDDKVLETRWNILETAESREICVDEKVYHYLRA